MNTQEQSEKSEINANYEKAISQLRDRGFDLKEMIDIRNGIQKWCAKFDDTIKHNSKHNCYESNRINNYAFGTEKEAKFANALLDLAPDANPEKLLQVMGIVTKLLDVDSDYIFKSK